MTDPQLKAVFEALLSRLASEPASTAARLLARCTHSVFESVEFDLSELEALTKADQDLVGQLFGVLMDTGITEEDRRAAALALQPYLNYQVH